MLQGKFSTIGLKRNVSTCSWDITETDKYREIGGVPKKSIIIATTTGVVGVKGVIPPGSSAFESISRFSTSGAESIITCPVDQVMFRRTQPINSSLNSDHTRGIKRANHRASEVSLSEAVLGGCSGIVRRSSS